MAPPDLELEAEPGRKLYWRPTPIAARIGMSVRAFVADCESGRIPIRVERLTERRIAYVHSNDVLAYLRSIGKGLSA